MSRDHSTVIIILLAGIFAVLLLGREAVQGSLESLFWFTVILGVILGIVAVIIWAIVAFIRKVMREAKAYQEEIRLEREGGRPWLYTFIMLPALLANFLVLGIAAYSRYINETCKGVVGDCLQAVPYWWLPITVFLASFFVGRALERIFLYFYKQALARESKSGQKNPG